MPFDLAALRADPGWREHLSWPVSQSLRRELLYDVTERVARALGTAPDGTERDAALVACTDILLKVLSSTNAAVVLERSRAGARPVVGGPPELSALSGEKTERGDYTPGAYLEHPRIRFPALRRLVRTASWSSPAGLFQAILKPDALVLSHNSLLRSYARQEGIAAWYYPPVQVMTGRVDPPGPDAMRVLKDFAAHISASAAGGAQLSPDLSAALEALLRDRLLQVMSRAHGELTKARRLRLAKQAWSGAMSAMNIRAAAWAVRSDGGDVTLFDHGGGTVTAAPNPYRAVRDYFIASKVVLPTREAAAVATREWQSFSRPYCPKPEFVGGPGEPMLRNVPRARSRDATAAPRVLYLPTPMLGFRELLPPILPDPVALDWQLRLAQTLKTMPQDVYVRPHPEGALPAPQHPVLDILPYANGPYNQVIEQTDKFVFEYQHSSAFWKVLCTDKPVILIDLGLSNLGERVTEIVSRRCQILHATYDEHNLPRVDIGALKEALCDPAEAVDPSEIRELLIGPGDA